MDSTLNPQRKTLIYHSTLFFAVYLIIIFQKLVAKSDCKMTPHHIFASFIMDSSAIIFRTYSACIFYILLSLSMEKKHFWTLASVLQLFGVSSSTPKGVQLPFGTHTQVLWVQSLAWVCMWGSRSLSVSHCLSLSSPFLFLKKVFEKKKHFWIFHTLSVIII